MKPKRDNIETFLARHSRDASECRTPPIAILIHSLHENFRGDLERLLAPFGVQFSEWGVLSTLHASQPPYCMSPTDINRGMLFSSGGLSKVIARLTKLGLIERLIDPADSRSKLARLTPEGIHCAESIRRQLKEIENQQLHGLSLDETAQLEALLNKLNQNWHN